jgi:hypothetical protein
MNNVDGKKSWKNKIDKLLFLFASLYLMTILGWYWKDKQKSNVSHVATQQTGEQTRVEENKVLNNQPIDAHKINENHPEELIQSIPLPEVEETSTTTIPTSNISNTQSSSFDQQTSLNTNLDNNIPLPPLPPPPTNFVSQNPQPISSPPSPQKTVSSPQKLAKVPIINTPKDSVTEQDTVTIDSSDSKTAISRKNDNYTYNLVGVGQLSDSDSFAIFNINDLPEKVFAGSEIGTSGWILMAVNDNKAVISREHKSMTIRVGESF